MAGIDSPAATPATPSRVPWVLAAATGAWAVLQLVLGTAWAMGAGGYPFVTDPTEPFPPLLADAPPQAVAPTIAAIGAAALAAVLTAHRVRRPGPTATAAAAVLAATGLVGLLLVPEVRLLAAVAYTPLLLVGAPFGWPEGVSLAARWPWPTVHQALWLGGALLCGATAVATRRSVRGACARCGRGATPARWFDAAPAARWGPWAVAVAVVVPLLYATTRFAWALGIPLGISEGVLRDGHEAGLWLAGAALGGLAVGGAGLTLGLHQRWGEVVPRWLPLIGGRRVRPALATVPALVVAALVTAAGLAFVRLLAVGALDDFFAGTSWAVLGPELLWPLWGVALAAAALASHLRRRGRCARCGRGEQLVGPRR